MPEYVVVDVGEMVREPPVVATEVPLSSAEAAVPCTLRVKVTDCPEVIDVLSTVTVHVGAGVTPPEEPPPPDVPPVGYWFARSTTHCWRTAISELDRL